MEININKPTKAQSIEIQIDKSSASENLDLSLVPSDNTDDFDYSVAKPNEQADFNYSVEEKETQPDFNYSVIPSLRKLSQFENDVGYITIEDIPEIDVPEIPKNLSEYNNDVGYITLSEVPKVDTSDLATKQELEQKQDKIADLDTIIANANKGATAVQPEQLATVATSGSYNDLTDKPEIPEGGGGGDVDVIGAIDGQSIYPYEVNTYREWENPYRTQNVYLGGDFGLSVDDVVEMPEGTFSKSFNITNGERETEFTISSMNDKYDSYFRFNSNQLYIDFTDRYGNMRNLTISARYGTVYYSDSERGDFELDLYDVMETLNNIING